MLTSIQCLLEQLDMPAREIKVLGSYHGGDLGEDYGQFRSRNWVWSRGQNFCNNGTLRSYPHFPGMMLTLNHLAPAQ